MSGRMEACLAAYAFIALLTFGYAATHHKVDRCLGRCLISPSEERAHTGLIAAMAWPLYWSWIAFEALEQGQ